MMRTGTKSVLFGVHQFLIHPVWVFLAWWRLYGFPFDPRLWLAFFVHDLGYLGCAKMDDDKGEAHVLFGAKIMGELFGKEWFDLCQYHSRFWAAKHNTKPSRLCIADKLVTVLEPWWFYLPRAIATGEVKEYMHEAVNGKHRKEKICVASRKAWYLSIQSFLSKWVEEHHEPEPKGE